jgi:hypothetical protein
MAVAWIIDPTLYETKSALEEPSQPAESRGGAKSRANVDCLLHASQGRFSFSHRAVDARYIDPDSWRARTRIEEGSWWPAWLYWLNHQSHGRAAPPNLGPPEKGYPTLEEAPGRYVLER